MKFKYVYLGYGGDYATRYNKEMSKFDNVFNVRNMSQGNKLLNFLCRVHLSNKINSVIHLPFRCIWLGGLFDEKTKYALSSEDRVFFDISAWYVYRFGISNIYEYLHSHYPKCVVAVSFTDRVGLFEKSIHGFSVFEVKRQFDCVKTYNEVDAEKYGLLLAPTVLHDYSDVNADGYSTTDVFFVGQDKGRLDLIYDVYEKCTAYGLKCDFHLVGIDPGRQKHKDKISFGGYIPYEEVLRRSKAARCILNIVQPGVKGITLRDYEAIGMNKLLMTNGEGLRDSDLYTEEKVIWLDNLENELWKFDKFDASKEWNNKDKHNPEKYFEWIEGILNDQVKK